MMRSLQQVWFDAPPSVDRVVLIADVWHPDLHEAHLRQLLQMRA